MKENPIISVIVPMYKVEKYVPRCLESIRQQTFQDFEVLMIDDGSPDRCAEIAAEFAQKDQRFLLFQKQNGGCVSGARNYGIDRAKGEYIVFIDSDDCLHKDYLKVLYEECTTHHAEISYCRFKHSYFMSKICIPMFSCPKKEVLDSEKALNLIIRDMSMHSYPWNKMYKTSVFKEHNIKYPEIYFEDLALGPILFFNASKIAVTNRYLYYYEKRGTSMMSTINMQKINDLLLAVLIIRNYIQYHHAYDKYKDSILFLAKKMYLINIYSIIRQHLIMRNFTHLKSNIKTNRKLYEYLISEDYQAVEGIPKLPFEMIQPDKKSGK